MVAPQASVLYSPAPRLGAEPSSSPSPYPILYLGTQDPLGLTS